MEKQTLVGITLGRYKITDHLGEGGMATVYKGYDSVLERNVAIKVIRSDKLVDASFVRRFEREARSLAQLTHPNIVHVNDFGEHKGLLYMVMDYLAGGTLKEKMGRPIPYQEAARLLAPIANALEFAHQRKIIHRDIKPANILLTESGQPMLSDFGIAKLLEAQTDTRDVTATGYTMGTPAYMAPEQAHKNYDYRADIYSLGVVFYEMITGKKPFDADTPLATLIKHSIDPLPLPRQFIPGLPEQVERVIIKALEKRPEDRYQSMEIFALELERLAVGKLEDVWAGKTTPVYAAPSPAGQTIALNTPTRGIPAVPHTVGRQTQPQKKKSSPTRLYLIVGLIGLGLVIISGGACLLLNGFSQGGLASFFQSESAVQTLTAEALAPQLTDIAVRQTTLTAQSAELAAIKAGATQASAPTLTKPPAAPAISPTPAEIAPPTATSVPKITTARVAFLDKKEVWVVSSDGNTLVQLTNDGAEKSNLAWMADGETVAYLSGKCIQMVNIYSLETKTLVCIKFVEKVTGFAFSADEKVFGVLSDKVAYIGEYAPKAIAKLEDTKTLTEYASIGRFTGVKYMFINADATQAALSSIAPGEDVVRLIDLKYGTKTDEFPGNRFRPYKFLQKPQVLSFGSDGRSLYSMSSSLKGDGLGYLYLYNQKTWKGQELDLLGTPCCYRDSSWSADGALMVMAYIDQAKMDAKETRLELYIIPADSIDTGRTYEPIPLPDDLLADYTSGNPIPVVYNPQ